MGWGVIDASGSRVQHVAHGVLAPSSTLPLAERLAIIFAGLEEVIERWQPEQAAIEQVFSARGARSALILGQARGVALLALQRAGLEIGEYAPAAIKLAVAGHGRASKEQLATMAGRLLGTKLQGESSDSTDALAIAICHAHGQKRERLIRKARSGGH